MKIDINNIDEGRFVIRDENNEEYVDQLAASLKEDGQWVPIIVRPKPEGRYEVIAGHYRLHAAKKAGFTEIEATVRDLLDEYADILSLKTNMLRLEMTPREQGQVLAKIMEEHSLSQREIAKRLNVSPDWVSQRVRVALELHEKVARQLMIDNNITLNTDAWPLRRRFLNDVIYTIGYQGHTAETFINSLKENKIERVMDVRFSAESQFKPEFNGPILRRELERNKIEYAHRPEFGLPHLIQNPYKEGALGYDCVKEWYNWYIRAEADFDTFVEDLKKAGKTALMCMEQYAKPVKDQKYACHRDVLADLILEYKTEDKLLKFNERVDL
jgi:ParB family chromosome partitioning protein